MLVGLGFNFNWDLFKLWVGVGFFVILVWIYDIDLVIGECILLKEQFVLGGYCCEDYVEWCDWVYGDDGIWILVLIVY